MDEIAQIREFFINQQMESNWISIECARISQQMPGIATRILERGQVLLDYLQEVRVEDE